MQKTKLNFFTVFLDSLLDLEDEEPEYIALDTLQEEENDESVDTLIEIHGIDEPTRVELSLHFSTAVELRNIFFEGESRNELRERLRQFFRVISENRNIVTLVLNCSVLHIPGVLLAEWMDWNEFVSELHLRFADLQSDMQVVCDALQQDTTIKTIIFDNLSTQISDSRLLGKCLQEKTGITSVTFYCDKTQPEVLQTVLTDALGLGSSIKNLTLCHIFEDDSNITEFVYQVENILAESFSLTSFTLKDTYGMSDIILPILRGVVNSDITEFSYFPQASEYGDEDGEHSNQHQHDRLEVISNMMKLTSFSFQLKDFQHLSSEYISSKLKGMRSLQWLSIDCDKDYLDLLKGIIKDISVWEQQPKLKLICVSPGIDLILLFKLVKLESLECHDLDNHAFDKMTQEIPTWMFLKELSICFADEPSLAQESDFAVAVSRNISLKTISFHSDEDSLRIQIQNKIDQVVLRNERLAQSKKCPEKVPLTKWPELLAIADPTGINFSFECIRKIPDIFIDLLRAGVERETSS